MTKENNERDLPKDSKWREFINNYIRISVYEIVLAGIFVGLYIISGLFINIKIQGVMNVGITFVFLMIFGLIFGPIKGVFIALIADTITLSLGQYGIGAWMWEYEMITVGIPIMAWLFKHMFNAKQKNWWISMIIINVIAIIGIIIVIIISYNNPLIHTASKKTLKFDTNTQIMIYIVAGIFIFIQLGMFILYKLKRNDKVKLLISITTLVTMIIIVWIWIWGPIAYVRFLQRLSNQGHSHYPISHYTYERYYQIALWARILKTPIIIPIYVAILIPLYKVCELTINKFEKNKY
ncbi:MAG: ECF transporter S component [Mycoplasmatales bacterium]|nr:ECF transporter S component [Mycoplasmatales bacterium]